jgi:hypothetical protein
MLNTAKRRTKMFLLMWVVRESVGGRVERGVLTSNVNMPIWRT